MSYTASATSKLEYSATEQGSYAQIKGLLSIPAIGDAPNKINTTTLDNTKFETAIDGLMPAVELEFEFNMEDPSVTSNIKLAYDIADAGTDYYWKITLSNGVTHAFKSKAKIGYREVGVDEIAGFFLYLSPDGEVETTIPNLST